MNSVMNPETRKALKGSIKKWEKIVKSTKAVDKGDENCPLCSLFFDKINCGDCPVKISTGQGCCSGTPYDAWNKHHRINHFTHGRYDFSRHPNCPDCLRLAKEELEFLRGLLPKKNEMKGGV